MRAIMCKLMLLMATYCVIVSLSELRHGVKGEDAESGRQDDCHLVHESDERMALAVIYRNICHQPCTQHCHSVISTLLS